jgi:ankyrin repeat protein
MRFTSLLLLLWLGGGVARVQALPAPDHQLTNAIRNAEAVLRGQRRDLNEADLRALAEATGRTNWLSQIVGEMLRTNNLNAADGLLQAVPGLVNYVQIYGTPVLFRAVQENNTNLVELLLNRRINPNGPVTYHSVPLAVALQQQRWGLAEKLVRAGASLHFTNIHGQHPAQFLLQSWRYGYGDSGFTNRLAFLNILLEHGFDPFSATGENGDRRSFVEQMVEMESGYPNSIAWGRSFFTGSINYPTTPGPRPDFSGLLLTNRADGQRRTPGGDTAWHVAAYWGHTNALAFLRAAGFSPDLTNAAGLTALQALAGSAPATKAASGASVGWLLDHDATVNVFTAAGLGLTNELAHQLTEQPELREARDEFGRTPLHYALNALPPNPNLFAMPPARFWVNGAMMTPPNPSTNEPASLATAKLLLDRGADVNVATRQASPRLNNGDQPLPAGTTPLHLLAQRNFPTLLRSLLAAKANPAAANAAGDTPLHLAARAWHSNSVQLLVFGKAPLNATNRDGTTPLRNAVEGGLTGSAAQLIDAGASLTNGVDGTTLLHLAARGYNGELVTLLLRHGLDLEARDGMGRTPLRSAVETRSWPPLRELQQRGADLNAADTNGNTALHHLATEQYDQVQREVEQSWWATWQRQQMQAPGWNGRAFRWLYGTKLFTPPPGVVWTNASLSEWLVTKGADVTRTNRAGQTPLHVLLSQDWMRYGQAEATNRIAMFLAAGARLAARDTNGFTPVTAALSANASPPILQFLLRQRGVDLNALDARGRTLVQVLLEGEQVQADRLAALLALGLNPNATNRAGQTPLHLVVGSDDGQLRWQRGEFLHVLLTNGANPNLADRAGDTPLHYALRSYASNYNYQLHEPLTRLLTNGANPNLTNRAGQTPLHLLAGAAHPYGHPGEHLKPWIDPARWNFNIADANGNTVVHLWATNLPNCWNCIEFFKLAATNGLLNATNLAGETPLHRALVASQEQLARALFQCGADPLLRTAQGATAFRLAIENSAGYPLDQDIRPATAESSFFNCVNRRDARALEPWLAADPTLYDVTNRNGLTPLLAATANGKTTLADRLLQLGAPLDPLSAMRLGRTNDFQRLLAERKAPPPGAWLFEAVQRGQLDSLEALVRAGGSVQAVDNDGHSLLFRAVVAKQTELSAWLKAQSGTNTFFDFVVSGDVTAVQNAIAGNTNLVNAPNANGSTPLMRAVAADQPAMVDLLLRRGAKANAAGQMNWNALHVAASRDAAEIVQRLLEAGLKPDAFTVNNLAPLHIAAAYGSTNVMPLLFARGASPNQATPNNGNWANTPLHWAAHRGQTEAVRLLLAQGAATQTKNSRNETPLDLARKSAQPGTPSLGFWAPAEARPSFVPRRPPPAVYTNLIQLLEQAEASATRPAAVK